MVSFYILSKRFFLKSEKLSVTRVESITKKEYGFAMHLYKDYISLYLVNIKVQHLTND